MDLKYDDYVSSLKKACNKVNCDYKGGKSLKDCVGNAFEIHRRHMWESVGLIVTSINNLPEEKKPTWEADNVIIDHKGNVVAFEEDKGHYLDSCFAGRAFMNIAQTICKYQRNNIPIPLFVIHSFTRFKQFEQKFDEALNVFHQKIRNEMKIKVKYTTLTSRDRIQKGWFKGKKTIERELDNEHAFLIHSNINLIKNDIEFLKNIKQHTIV